MKNALFLGLFILLPFSLVAQSTYYQKAENTFWDSLTYENAKAEQLEKVRTSTKNDKLEIVDDLTILRQSKDSIIMTYKWIFTEDAAQMKADLEHKKGMLGKHFSF